jgi:protoporphyrinogen oxidase
MTTNADLVVLGAGPAGLAAAWQAARRGMSVVVLERAQAVGGMAASLEVAGVRVDRGSHRLHPTTPANVLADLRVLLGDDLQLRRRNGRLHIADRWLGFPLRPTELARALPPGLIARAGAEAILAPLRRGRTVSYADALRRGLGPTLYEALYAPYAVKLWGRPGEQIDAEQARRRVSADTPWKIASRMLRRRPGGAGRMFYYPRRGFGQIVEALAEAAVKAGADIRLGAQVDDLAADSHGVDIGIATMAAADGGQPTGSAQIRGGHVFSTIPLPVLARICQPGPPAAAIESAGRLRFRAMVLVYVVQRSRPWTPYDAHYLPDLDTPITRISEPANYRESSDDPRDRTVLCCEIPCTLGDAIWEGSDEDLRAIVTDTLVRTGLPALTSAEMHVERLPHVYPVYEVGYRRHLRGIDTWAATVPNVTTFGRLGLFVHDNTHHTIAMAYDAVDAIAAGRFDEAAWAAARARFETHVVED